MKGTRHSEEQIHRDPEARRSRIDDGRVMPTTRDQSASEASAPRVYSTRCNAAPAPACVTLQASSPAKKCIVKSYFTT